MTTDNPTQLENKLELPERIFAFKRSDGGNSWHYERLEESDVEYIRADVVRSRDAEIREVLEGLMTRRWFGDKPTACWCDPRAYPDSDDDADQDARCRRTRALWAKIQTDQINGASSTPKG